jgi:imidazolonepropionase-like amidohydrolase
MPEVNKLTFVIIRSMSIMKLTTLLVLIAFNSFSQTNNFILIKADQLFDGEEIHTGWSVFVKNNKIEQVGIINTYPANTQVFEFKGSTIMPGMIEGHSHLFLHPYNEVSWNDQVLKESRAERTARAVNHARATLSAGFTTVRDLGTEGAMYDDVGLKKAIEKGVIPGPRMIIATRAIVAKGTYAPKSATPDDDLPQGAAEVGNINELVNEVRTEIGKGADVIKIYADYRWGRDNEALPTFTVEELSRAVEIANMGGRQVVAHASTTEGMRRSAMAGVSTIEHGNAGTIEVFKLMKAKKVALCPTLAATDAIAQYSGWKKGIGVEPSSLVEKRKSFRLALEAGVTICMGGDVGVFPHGENAREMELMVEFGMKPLEVLRSATSVNADVFGYGEKIGRLRKGMLADIIVVDGKPQENISDVRKIRMVMKDGVVVK